MERETSSESSVTQDMPAPSIRNLWPGLSHAIVPKRMRSIFLCSTLGAFVPRPRSAYPEAGLFDFFFQSEQCFSLIIIQLEKCFSTSFS